MSTATKDWREAKWERYWHLDQMCWALVAGNMTFATIVRVRFGKYWWRTYPAQVHSTSSESVRLDDARNAVAKALKESEANS